MMLNAEGRVSVSASKFIGHIAGFCHTGVTIADTRSLNR